MTSNKCSTQFVQTSMHKTIDTDVIVVALVAFPKLLSLIQDISFWVEFGKARMSDALVYWEGEKQHGIVGRYTMNY